MYLWKAHPRSNGEGNGPEGLVAGSRRLRCLCLCGTQAGRRRGVGGAW